MKKEQFSKIVEKMTDEHVRVAVIGGRQAGKKTLVSVLEDECEGASSTGSYFSFVKGSSDYLYDEGWLPHSSRGGRVAAESDYVEFQRDIDMFLVVVPLCGEIPRTVLASLERLKQTVTFHDHNETPYIIVGNKCDLRFNFREVYRSRNTRVLTSIACNMWVMEFTIEEIERHRDELALMIGLISEFAKSVDDAIGKRAHFSDYTIRDLRTCSLKYGAFEKARHAPMVGVSALTGDGVDALRAMMARVWRMHKEGKCDEFVDDQFGFYKDADFTQLGFGDLQNLVELCERKAERKRKSSSSKCSLM